MARKGHTIRCGTRGKAPLQLMVSQRLVTSGSDSACWRVMRPSKHVKGGVPIGEVCLRKGRFYYTNPATRRGATVHAKGARTVRVAACRLARADLSWIGVRSYKELGKPKRRRKRRR